MASDVPVPGIGTTASNVPSRPGGTCSSQGRADPASARSGGPVGRDPLRTSVPAATSPGDTTPIVHLKGWFCQKRKTARGRAGGGIEGYGGCVGFGHGGQGGHL